MYKRHGYYSALHSRRRPAKAVKFSSTNSRRKLSLIHIFFLDQKYNRRAVARLAAGHTVLDCFTHTGSFALNARCV